MKNIKKTGILAWLTIATTVILMLILAKKSRLPNAFESSNMSNVMIALANYNDSYESLPQHEYLSSDNTRRTSWRYAIASWIATPPRDHTRYPLSPPGEYDWTSPEMRHWRSLPLLGFCNPESDGETHTFAIVGPDTPLGSKTPCNMRNLHPDTVMCIYTPSLSANWLSPINWSYVEIVRNVDRSIGEVFGKPVYAGFADCSVGKIDENFPMSRLVPFLTIDGAATHNRSEIIKK